MDFNSFINRIKAVEKAPLRYFIVDPDLPLSVYFGLDNIGRPTLLIEDVGTYSIRFAMTCSRRRGKTLAIQRC